MQITLLPDMAITGMLVFARIGTLVMLMPTLGERAVPARSRLAIALLLSLIFFPLAKPLFPATSANLSLILNLFFTELAIGLTIGLIARVITSIMVSGGTIIANYMGLGFVTMVDPSQQSQGTAISTFLGLMGLAMIFATDLHYLAIAGLHDSYTTFRPGIFPDITDATAMMIKMVADTFTIAMQISAPFLIVSVVLNVSLGLISKMMPQMQVFFVAMPLTIFLGLLMIAAFLGLMMNLYMTQFSAGLGQFLLR